MVILPKMDFRIFANSMNYFLVKDIEKILYTPQNKNSPVEAIKTLTLNETGQTVTDSINICYVAMTRPIERLFIHNQFKNEKEFGGIFNNIIQKFDDITEIENSIVLKRGNLNLSNEELKSTNSNTYFIPQNINSKLWFPDISLQYHDELKDDDELSEAQRYGNQLHLVLSIVQELSLIHI